MANRTLLAVALLLIPATTLTADDESTTVPDSLHTLHRKPSAERGREAVWDVSSPLTGTLGSWTSIWKQWGLSERPEDFVAQAAERYGIPISPREGDEYPLGLKSVPGPFGPALGHNCLLCHAGRIAGQTVIGLGNSTLDLQSLMDEVNQGEPIPFQTPFNISNGRGTIEAFAGTIFQMRFRDAELNQQAPNNLRFSDQLWEEMPAWWLLKYKKTMFHTGATDTRALRSSVSFFLNPLNTAEFAKSQVPLIGDIREYILSLEAPKYPFPIDRRLAAQGESLFVENCSECHGTYGKDRHYPNVVVPADEVGTDPDLATWEAGDDLEYYLASWLYRETGPDGEPLHLVNHGGYQAPPLDGVWATAPYFHNGSVPTIAHVLNSKSRPKLFTRSFSTEKEAYDQTRVGWKTAPVGRDEATQASPYGRRRITDTSRPGRGNQGHTYGDHLSDSERLVVLEYLKSL